MNQRIFTIILLLVLFNGVSFGQESGDIKPLSVKDRLNPKKYVVKDINITGVSFLDPSMVAGSVGLNKGDTVYIPGDYITSALKKLWSQRYYSDVKSDVEIVGDTAAIINIRLKERPRVSLWEFEGIRAGERKALLDKLKLRNNAEASDYAIQSAIDQIKAHYHKKGFLNVEVTTTQRNDTITIQDKNFVILTFHVRKNDKVKVKEISFRGNEVLPDKRLKGAMKEIKEKTLLNILKSSKYDPEKLEEDKLKIIDFMQSKGYRDGNVLSDSIYMIGEKRKRMGIVMDVYEGEKYYYRDITWTGNVKYNEAELNRLLGIKKGDVYDKKNLNARLGTSPESITSGDLNVSSLYLDDGHLAFMVEPVETVVSGDSIDMDIRILEGKQFRINEVRIQGNTRTHDRVIRRELFTNPGELYSQSLLVQSVRELGSMGHFNDNIAPEPQPVSDGLVDISYTVEERANDQFEVSGGWGGGVFIASVGVTFNNVSLRNFFKKGQWRPYPAGDNQQLSLRVQTNGTYYTAFSFSFYEPWLGGKKPNAFGISLYYSNQSDSYYTLGPSTAHFATIGASVTYGKRLSWPDPWFHLMGEVTYQAYLLENWSNFLFKNGTANIISLGVQFSRNSIDHPIYPRNGSEFSLKATFTPPYSLFRKKGYYDNPDLTAQQRYRWIEYYKAEANFKWYLPMLTNNNLVFMAAAEMGYLGHYSTKAKSPFEGYSMGGDGVSGYTIYGVNDIGLRGYGQNALTPWADYGQQAQLYNKFVLELRYPILMQSSTSVYGLIFAEAGNAFYGWREYNPFNLKRSMGAGLRLYLPIVGMFGIDWGYGFDRAPGEQKASGGHFHFSIGRQF